MEQHSSQGGNCNRLPEMPRWPKYIGKLALDAWLSRVAEYDDAEPSVELFIAQYPGENLEPEAAQPYDQDPMQLPLHLQWGNEPMPTDLAEQPLTPTDTEAMGRLLATAVNIFAGRTALFALYTELDPTTYAAMATRLRTGTRLPAQAELQSAHGQYVTKRVIEACGIASAGTAVRALVARLERRRRRWMGTELRLL